MQTENHVSSLGFDYKEGNYIVYAQLFSFGNLAKQAGTPSGKPSVYIGKGEGKAILSAIDNLVSNSHLRLNFSHVKTIVLSEEFLEHGEFDKLIDGMTRNRQLRLKPYIYGTKEKVEDILTISGYFNLPPMYTNLVMPEDHFKQRSHIPPIMLHEFIIDIYEPATTVQLPSVKITTKWKEQGKETEVVTLDGIYAIEKGRLKGWLSESELNGKRWLNGDYNKSLTTLESNNELTVVQIFKPKGKVVINTTNPLSFRLHLTGKGAIIEQGNKLAENAIEKELNKVITREIETTFTTAIAQGIDIYNVKEKIYRSNLQGWKEIQDNQVELTRESLKDIVIDIELTHAGDRKMKNKGY
ncbi:Ger(x)C family germination protein [Bacillus luteolus]|nr:Ger(x)C family germination protein [Cytobacillus luteolus]